MQRITTKDVLSWANELVKSTEKNCPETPPYVSEILCRSVAEKGANTIVQSELSSIAISIRTIKAIMNKEY